jgi:polysaccharide biosynthesis protein PslH
VRILYLTHRLPYAANRGDRIRAHHILRHLAVRHQVDLVSLVHDDDEESHVGDLAGIADSVTVARVSRVRQARRAAGALLTGEPLTHALLDAAGFEARLAEVVQRHPPDAVLALCSSMARFALAPPLAGLPFVLDMVDVDSEKWAMLGRTARMPRAWIFRREASRLGRFERLAADAADATLVVNERERQSLAALGVTGRIAVVPNGVELSSFRPSSPPATEPRVVFCGVMNYEPNEAAALWLAREVWPRVRRVRADARLTLLGASPTRQIRRLQQDDSSIEVTGSVPDVRPFLWQAAVSAAPLFVARGVQNKVLEAVAAGLPSVVSKAVFEGLPSEVMPACVQADGPPAFAAEIGRLLACSPAERRAMAGRATLEPLAWSRRLHVLEDILHAAAPGQRRTA